MIRAPRVRVFVLTYRRSHLLRRALRSLLDQSFTGWVCEVHNDAPDDPSPQTVLNELAAGDPRFTYHTHATNWGPVRSFNHVYAGGPEELAALLEDDNWWEQQFLERMLSVMDSVPDAALAWANMRIWRESENGTWLDTGRAIWGVSGDAPIVFRSPEYLQAFDALHSNGAAVFRPRRFRPTSVPETASFAIVECLRERAAAGPLVFCPEVLANYSVTSTTARGANVVAWVQSKLLVAASFFAAKTPPPEILRKLWSTRRRQFPPDTDIFFLLALALRRFSFVRDAKLKDAMRFFAHAIRHPAPVWRILRFRRDHRVTWQWLREVSATMGEPNCSVINKEKPALPATGRAVAKTAALL